MNELTALQIILFGIIFIHCIGLILNFKSCFLATDVGEMHKTLQYFYEKHHN